MFVSGVKEGELRSVELSDLIWLSVEKRTRGQPGPCKVKDPICLWHHVKLAFDCHVNRKAVSFLLEKSSNGECTQQWIEQFNLRTPDGMLEGPCRKRGNH